MAVSDLKVVYRDPKDLKGYVRNARKHPEAQITKIRASLREFGFTNPILLKDDGKTIGAGHGRQEAAIAEGMAEVPTITLHGLTEAQWRAYVLADNRLALDGAWDPDLLKSELLELNDLGFDLSVTGFGDLDFAELGLPGFEPELPAPSEPEPTRVSLNERFGVAPFTTLNAREGWWQDRKRAWLALGIRSEVGRGDNLLRMSDTMLEPDPERRAAMAAAKTKGPETAALKGGLKFGTSMHPYDATGERRNARHKANAEPEGGGGVWNDFNDKAAERRAANSRAIGGSDWIAQKKAEGDIDGGMNAEKIAGSGTSIFDPVLCELAYRWWCPPKGQILDPFAGGSVRGLVASRLGRRYAGIDLRAEQVEANRAQAAQIARKADPKPKWLQGDSRRIPELAGDVSADFVFSCPPYADLEVYSEDPQDISTLAYADFREAYFEIIAHAAARLKPDRFACFVVGDVRDSKGNYYGFVRDTELAFKAAGLELYNEAILITAAGSLALRAGRQFEISRKLGKSHQNVLVFVKGDWRKAVSAIGKVEFADIAAEEPPGDQAEPRPPEEGDEAFGERL